MRLRETSALIVVDMQWDFADPHGSLYVAGGEELVAPVNSLIDEAQRVGAVVAYTQDWHPETTPHFAKDGGIWPVHCVAGTRGAELVADLHVVGPLVRKGTQLEDGYSGFSEHDLAADSHALKSTNLDSLLRSSGVTELVVVGLAGDYCVKATAIDGRRLGFDVVVPLSLTRFVDLAEGDGARAVRELEDAGVTVDH